MLPRLGWSVALALGAICSWSTPPQFVSRVKTPYQGVTFITRTATSTREQLVSMHILKIDLTAPGIAFRLSPSAPSAGGETTTQSTLDYMNQEGAQAAINTGFFLPAHPDSSTPYPTDIVGLAISGGHIYSGFEAPSQAYALVANAPAINIDGNNHAAVVHADTDTPPPDDVRECVVLWNAFAGSAQIVTNGVKTIPCYRDTAHPECQLTPGNGYHNDNSWYHAYRARTAAGLSMDNRTLILFTADEAGGSTGMRIDDVADILIHDFHVHNALNLDGGGSTTMALRDPKTGVGSVVNTPHNIPSPRLVGNSLAIFARPLPI